MKDLVYGNINKEDLNYLNMKNVFTQFVDEYKSSLKVPDFMTSTDEIAEMLKVQRKAKESKHWRNIEEFCKGADGDLNATLHRELGKIGVPITKEYVDWLVEKTQALGGLVVKLKNHFQRPRPYQVAWYSKQPLHPMETISGNSPAFPSGHACQGKFLSLVVSSHYPEKRVELRKFSENISQSRILMGLHYPSDNIAGERIATELFDNKIIQKYLND